MLYLYCVATVINIYCSFVPWFCHVSHFSLVHVCFICHCFLCFMSRWNYLYDICCLVFYFGVLFMSFCVSVFFCVLFLLFYASFLLSHFSFVYHLCHFSLLLAISFVILFLICVLFLPCCVAFFFVSPSCRFLVFCSVHTNSLYSSLLLTVTLIFGSKKSLWFCRFFLLYFVKTLHYC